MNQTDLFRLTNTPEVRHKGGYPRPPGTGPAGEKCGTCKNCVPTGPWPRVFYKCKVIQFRWTHGPGTDIKKKTPACEMWQAR